jgi:hypothetical protein
LEEDYSNDALNEGKEGRVDKLLEYRLGKN